MNPALLASLIAAFAHGPVPRPVLPDPLPIMHQQACPVMPAGSPPGLEYACTIGDDVYSPPSWGAYVEHHELGHVYLARYLDDWERAQLAPVLGRRRWGAPGGTVDERAADLYAACRLRVRPDFEDGWQPSRGRWAYGCELLKADREGVGDGQD